MKSVLRTVLFQRTGSTVIDECRRCGTTVGSAVSDCPECDCGEIVSYEIQ